LNTPSQFFDDQDGRHGWLSNDMHSRCKDLH
jgi:hypothetical protein